MTYKCNKCGKTLTSKEALYEHLKTWHKHLPNKIKRTLRKSYDRNERGR